MWTPTGSNSSPPRAAASSRLAGSPKPPRHWPRRTVCGGQPPLSDILDAPFARNAAARLDELRTGAAEDRFEAELGLGRHAQILADLGGAAARHPLSERLAMLRMRALSASGRQSDAFAVYEQIRAGLSDELGVDPSPQLRELHLSLLRGQLNEYRHRRRHRVVSPPASPVSSAARTNWPGSPS